MTIITKANYLENREKLDIYEQNCGKDTVDRSDYISAEEQYYNLVLAGIQLKRAREDMFDFDEELEEYKTNRLFTRYMDKIDTIEKYRDKLHEYNVVKKQSERLKDLHERYLKEQEQIELQNAIRKELNSVTTEVVKNN